ncbi:hypothetical protein [Mycobacterium sp. HUMS_1102779]
MPPAARTRAPPGCPPPGAGAAWPPSPPGAGAVVERAAKAEHDRTVTIRPAPTGHTYRSEALARARTIDRSELETRIGITLAQRHAA